MANKCRERCLWSGKCKSKPKRATTPCPFEWIFSKTQNTSVGEKVEEAKPLWAACGMDNDKKTISVPFSRYMPRELTSEIFGDVCTPIFFFCYTVYNVQRQRKSKDLWRDEDVNKMLNTSTKQDSVLKKEDMWHVRPCGWSLKTHKVNKPWQDRCHTLPRPLRC